MARDKLITVRIEEDYRDRFNQWAKDNHTDTSTVLYEFVRRCIDGKIDVDIALGKKIIPVGSIDDDRLDSIDGKIRELIGSIRTIDERIAADRQQIDKRIDDLEKRIGERKKTIGDDRPVVGGNDFLSVARESSGNTLEATDIKPVDKPVDPFATIEIDREMAREHLDKLDKDDREAILNKSEGLSAVVVGRIVGVADSTLGRWWRGVTDPGDDPRLNIAAMFYRDDKKLWHLRPEYRAFFES